MSIGHWVLFLTISNLKTVNRDWAWWDDSYEFIEDVNPEFINSSLSNETLTGVRLNLIIYINSAGETVFARAFDFRIKKSYQFQKV